MTRITPIHAARRRAPGRVLLVEDEPPLRLVLRRFLESQGYEVVEAHDFDGAAERLAEGPFQGILLDLNLPGGSGRELFRLMEEKGEGLRERTIFMTGGFLDPGTETFVESTGRPTLMKPFALRDLAAALVH